jgi:hypothetical protein
MARFSEQVTLSIVISSSSGLAPLSMVIAVPVAPSASGGGGGAMLVHPRSHSTPRTVIAAELRFAVPPPPVSSRRIS